MMEAMDNQMQSRKERFLPPLSVEYNKDFIIDRATMTAEDIELLNRSGYRIFHRPNLAMMGWTHKKITLNPYLKDGRDAGEKGMPAISFQEYLELFR